MNSAGSRVLRVREGETVICGLAGGNELIFLNFDTIELVCIRFFLKRIDIFITFI